MLGWLNNLPWYYETKHFIFTHASIDISGEDWHFPPKGWCNCAWDDGSFINTDTSHIKKNIVVGHFHCRNLRMKNMIQDGEDLDAILRVDNKKFIDACTIVSRKVNILVVEDEEDV